LFAYPDATLLDIQPLLTNYDFRKRILSYCKDQYILSFWYNEFDKYSPQLKAEAISPILNKTGLFIAISQLRNVIGQTRKSFQIQDVMDEGKILICNLSKGKMGEDATTVLGSMLVNAIQLAALNRAAIAEENRKPFYLYVDEMHSFISISFADILAEARKYKLSLFLAHQYIEQVHEKIRYAIFGNVGTMIIFRVGAEDAKHLAQEVNPIFSEEDLIALPRYSMYIKLTIDGASSKPFSANTIGIDLPMYSNKYEVIHSSRELYGIRKEIIQEEIENRYSALKKGFDSEQNSLFK
jgi:hypothetical protein